SQRRVSNYHRQWGLLLALAACVLVRRGLPQTSLEALRLRRDACMCPWASHHVAPVRNATCGLGGCARIPQAARNVMRSAIKSAWKVDLIGTAIAPPLDTISPGVVSSKCNGT